MSSCCNSCCRILSSSIGKKVVVAIAGLLLCGFLLTHLAGNMFLFVGEQAFNRYADALMANPAIIPAEIVLASIFLVHILLSLKVTWENRQARPTRYEMFVSKGGRTLGSSTMAVSGLLLLTFLVVHIKTFKFVDHSDGLYRVVMDAFANKLYSGFYVVAMCALGLHLSHGVQSAFQTFGLRHPRYTPLIKAAGIFFAAAVATGFATLPIWAGFIKGGAQ